MTDTNYDPMAAAFILHFDRMAHLAHANSRAKGFWAIHDWMTKQENAKELEVIWRLSRHDLIHSEVSEATEGVRKDQMDDHLPERSMEVCELADVIIRCLDLAGAYGLPLGETIVEKMRYNAGRPAMHGGKLA